MNPKRKLPLVIIGHQSTIPHYRVEFYNQLRAASIGVWDFKVVYDPDQQNSQFSETIDTSKFNFETLPVKTCVLKIGNRTLIRQSISRHLSQASLIITDTHLSNISYPWAAFRRPSNCKWALWGHCENRNLSAHEKTGFIARGSSALKKRYIRFADGFLAYTESQKSELIKSGFPEDKAFTVQNTVDVKKQRDIAIAQFDHRDELRKQFGFRSTDTIFVTIGRMLPGRRIDFLLESFRTLRKKQPNAHLILIGSGASQYQTVDSASNGIHFPGSIVDPELLGTYLTAADAYIAPGMLGLGILQPLAHELPLLGFNLETHGPEVDYLTPQNSTLLPANTPSQEFANILAAFCANPDCRRSAARYNSISNLTQENMATQFDKAIRTILDLQH